VHDVTASCSNGFDAVVRLDVGDRTTCEQGFVREAIAGALERRLAYVLG
jgi:hypothetical protein